MFKTEIVIIGKNVSSVLSLQFLTLNGQYFISRCMVYAVMKYPCPNIR